MKQSFFRNIPLPVIILACGIILQAAIVFSYSLTRIYTFRISVNEIGTTMQVLHSIVAYGAPLTTFQLSSGEHNWFGTHFSPLMYPVAYIYALLPAPATLEALHAAFISLSAIPVYLAARNLGLERRAGCAVALAYLFNPCMLNASFWCFCDKSLSVLWMAIALWAITASRFGWLVASSVLLVLTEDHYGISVFMLGLLWWWRHKEKCRGLSLAIFGIVSMALVMLVIMPHYNDRIINPTFHDYLAENNYGWILSLDQWKDKLPQVLVGDLVYIWLLFFCFCFFPIAGAEWLIAGSSDFLVVLLSGTSETRQFDDVHCIPLMPVLAVASCVGYIRMRHKLRSRIVMLGAGGVLAFVYLYLSPLWYNKYELPLIPQLSLAPQDAEAVRAINKIAPAGTALAVQDNIGAFFLDHRKIYMFPQTDEPPVENVVLWLDSPLKYSGFRVAPYGMFPYLNAVNSLLQDPRIKIIYWQKPWLVMSRYGNEVAGARPEVEKAYDKLADTQQFLYGLVGMKFIREGSGQ